MLRYTKWMLALSLLVLGRSACAEQFSWKFTPDGWKQDEWVRAKSPYDAHFGKWLQKPDHIQNEGPADATPAEWQSKHASECYASMVFGKRFSGDARVTSTMDFTPEMAPLIVLVAELGKDAKGQPEYREYFEFCVHTQGVNVWHHTFKDGKPSYKKAAYVKFALKPDTKYTLDVEIKGKQFIIRIDGQEFGYTEETIPSQYYLGVTGCEGLNRFYDMSVTGKVVAGN